MSEPAEVFAKRVEVFLKTVVSPAVRTDPRPVSIEVHQCADPISFAQAAAADYQPVSVGWEWGPVWSTAWFRVRGSLPSDFVARPVDLAFSSGTEALVWQQGEPLQGLDVNRKAVPLYEAMPDEAAEQPREWMIEAACNHPFGISTFEWDAEEVHHRWRQERPGRLELAELCVRHPKVEELEYALAFAIGLLRLQSDGSGRATELCAALDEVIRRVDTEDVAGSACAALEPLLAALRVAPSESTSRCHAVGHAHIDTAWLWPIRETKRKCMRSFSNVLGLMERFDDFRFVCSQAQQYAWVEERSPTLFERIKERVEQGRWEPAGAMWVEPDCNVPSGEALVRQIVHATRYWTSRFGDRGRQEVLYLPDTFGFPASLPQIMRHAGLGTFITNKLSWNTTNQFPYTNFVWRGNDGSEVLAHFTPGGDYNATNSPAELGRGVNKLRDVGDARPARWLQPFGFGDGGGGPTAQQIVNARLSESCEGMPRVKLDGMLPFCEALARDRDVLLERGADFPTWAGELYLEIHRGVLTTQGAIKRANRRAESGLRLAELLAFAGPQPLERQAADALQDALDATWKTVLKNQFHDILPGTSIQWVHRECLEDFASVHETLEGVQGSAIDRWCETLDPSGCTSPYAVFNPTSRPRTARVEVDSLSFLAEDVPALGVKVVDARAPQSLPEVEVGERRLANEHLELRLDDVGRIESLVHRATGRDACEKGPINQLVLYEDRPHQWDAWDIDAGYEKLADPITSAPESIRVVVHTPARGAIEVTRPLGTASRLVQTYCLDAGSPRIDVHSRVEWHEDHKLLRTLFDVDVFADEATYEIQFGTIRRATHRNTSWDAAKFEVCAHGWMDLSEPGFGVALLNDSKYGHSCHGSAMGISLLRSPKHPDPDSDMGTHEFTYSIQPHAGDWRAAGVTFEAEALNDPLIARPLSGTGAQREWSPLTIETTGEASVRISALKPSESNPHELVLRLWEASGARGNATIHWNLPVTSVDPVDALEEPTEHAGFTHESARSSFPLRPFQLVSLRLALR